MRVNIFLLLGLLCTAFPVCADEQLLVLKVGGDIYSNVTITSVSATDIYFTHSAGIGSVKLKDLDAALQQHFHFDPTKAKTAEQQSKAGNASYLTGTSTGPLAPDLNNPKATLDAAMERVRVIVNQPVTQLQITPGMRVSISSPGWFHPGAMRPDFNNADVRATQKLDYIDAQYVSSDLNPGVCFLGAELEFNPMTKFFYTDRSVPKKRLTEDEMIEVNRLYRIIGQCEEKLGQTSARDMASNSGGEHDAASAVKSAVAFLSAHKTTVVSAAAGLLLVSMFILNLRKKPAC
jgi:hypothetical protein